MSVAIVVGVYARGNCVLGQCRGNAVEGVRVAKELGPPQTYRNLVNASIVIFI